MCMQSNPTILAKDTVLTSERNGSARIIWAPASTWGALRGAPAFSLRWRVLAADSTAVARVFAQTSIDGITWEDPTITSENPIPGVGGLISSGMSGTYISGTELLWAGGMMADAPFTRLGVQVQDSDEAREVEIRLSLTMTPTFQGGNVVLGYQHTFADLNSMVGQDLGGPFDTLNIDQLMMNYNGSSDMIAGDAVTFQFKTGPSRTGPWSNVGAPSVFLHGAVTSELLPIDKTVLSNFSKVVVVSAAEGTPVGNPPSYFDVLVTVRTNS